MKDALKEEEEDWRHESIGKALGALEYDCFALVLANYVYGIPLSDVSNVLRTALSEPGSHQPFGRSFSATVAKLFDRFGKQLKHRRDYCWKKFKEEMSRQGSTDSKAGTKRDSRRG